MNHFFKERIINEHFFKTIFTNSPNILTKLISDITKIPYSKLKNNIYIITNKQSITNKHDFIIKLNNNTIINKKLNTKKYKGLKNNNLSYSLNIYYNNPQYSSNFLIIQINFNTFRDKKSNYIDVFELRNKQGTKYIDNFKIFTLDIVKCHKLYYNNPKTNNNIIKWGAFLYSKIKEKNIISILSNTLELKDLNTLEFILKDINKKETN
ncbi:MAG: hypothetical protein VZS44_06010 [Bacilli bacterium]|nr:hypothetical protein [Bacilli bacterium]